MKRIICVAIISMLPAATASAQQPTRAAGQRPDLSGIWSTFPGVNPVSGLKREVAGVADTRIVDRTAIRGVVSDGRGVLPWTPAPSPKPEFQAKVKALDDQQSKTDPVFYCARPGLPRVGPPRRIIQMPNEMIFLYEDMSGDPVSHYSDRRSRAPRKRKSVVLRRRGGEMGRGDARHRRPELRRGYVVWARRATSIPTRCGLPNGYGVTGESRVAGYRGRPQRPHGSWTMAPRMIKRSTQPLEESPACREQDGALLRNDDHHDQR